MTDLVELKIGIHDKQGFLRVGSITLSLSAEHCDSLSADFRRIALELRNEGGLGGTS